MLIKDLKPKYEMIELMEGTRDTNGFNFLGLMKFEDVKKEYWGRNILSVMDFDKTHTTSIIMEKIFS